MDDYVSKPLDPDRLIKAIQTLLANTATSTTLSSAVGEQTAPISVEALMNRCMGKVAVAASILDEFEREAVDDLAQIKQRVETGDLAGLAQVAHSLKGASSILAADALTDIALKLEEIGRAGVMVEQDQLLSQLNDEIQRCISYLPAARTAIAKGTKV